MNEELIRELQDAAEARRKGNVYAVQPELLDRAVAVLTATPGEVAEEIARGIEPNGSCRSQGRTGALIWAAKVARNLFSKGKR